MRKTLLLALDVERKKYSGIDSVVLTFSDSAVSPCTLGLYLLREDLASVLRLCPERGGGCIELELERKQRRSRSVATWSDNLLNLRLTESELELWADFFLKYFRDGFGRVNHIDLEFTEPGGVRLDLAIYVQQVGDAISPADAERLLGLR